MICDIKDPITQRAVLARPALHRARRRRSTSSRPASRTRATSGPSRSSSSSTTSASTRPTQRRLLLRRLASRARGTAARTRGPNLGYKPRYKEGYFPVPPHDTLQDIRSEMVLTMEQVGITDRGAPPRSGDRRPVRDRHALRHAREDGRRRCSGTSTSSRTSREARQDGDLHAEAALRRQRLGHAHPPVALEGRQAALLRQERLRADQRDVPLLHRRAAARTAAR